MGDEGSAVVKTIASAGVLALAGLAVFGLATAASATDTNYATVTGHETFSSDANHASYWGKDCTKVEDPGGSSYILGSGTYSKVVVKAGSGEYANTIFDNPNAGETVWADTNGDNVYNPDGKDGDKTISHIILCKTESPPPPPADPSGSIVPNCEDMSATATGQDGAAWEFKSSVSNKTDFGDYPDGSYGGELTGLVGNDILTLTSDGTLIDTKDMAVACDEPTPSGEGIVSIVTTCDGTATITASYDGTEEVAGELIINSVTENYGSLDMFDDAVTNLLPGDVVEVKIVISEDGPLYGTVVGDETATVGAVCPVEITHVTATVPTVTPVCGPNNDTVNLPTKDGVKYVSSGWKDGALTVTASAVGDNVVLDGTTSWPFVDKNVACPVPPTRDLGHTS